MKVLIACEYSGRVRDAFSDKGHQVASVDLIPTLAPGNHIIANVLDIISDKWDMMIAFPPCTYLTTIGSQWNYLYPDRGYRRNMALLFVKALMDAPISRIAIENPVGAISSRIRKPDQIIQPWHHGHPYTKATCLWLKGLAPLHPSNILATGRQSWMDVAKKNTRSITFNGIAKAMADQWG